MVALIPRPCGRAENECIEPRLESIKMEGRRVWGGSLAVGYRAVGYGFGVLEGAGRCLHVR